MTALALETMRQHQLVILRRLRESPLTEFELTKEITEHSGYSSEESTDRIAAWLDELRREGLIWLGALTNSTGQNVLAAALTSLGRSVVH